MKSITPIAGYKSVVIGGPVYTGKIAGNVTVFVSTNKDELSGVLVALHRDLPKTGEVEGFTDQLVTASSPVLPVAITMFAGSLDAIKMNFDEQNLTSLVKFPTGDFRDWDTINAWVRALAGKMGLCGGIAKTDGICRCIN
jgi:menaquinone-dependent protoporphyrinogen IX oxidase